MRREMHSLISPLSPCSWRNEWGRGGVIGGEEADERER